MDIYDHLFNYINSRVKLERSAFSVIADCFKAVKFNKRDYLLREGEVCNFNVFVGNGCLRLFTLNEEGEENTRHFCFEDKFGTALTSFIEQKPSFESFQAVEKTEVLIINRNDFLHKVETIPQINFIYKDMLENAYIYSQQRILGLQGDNALERIKWLMTYQPKILSRLPNKIVASYLGITPYTLSRLKSEL
jgi:CRP-like cAMP-binding protein